MKNVSKIEHVTMSDISVPRIVESYTEDFVLNGEKNGYFRMLIELYNESATNGSAINEISRLVYGKGLAIVDEKNEGEFIEDSPELEAINKLIKPKDLKRFILDRIMLGNAALQVIYKGIGHKKTVAEIKHFPVYTLAAKKITKGDVEGYYYHPNWEKYQKGDKLTLFPSFGYDGKTSKGGNIEMYICRPYCPNSPYWSPVDYSGGLDYAAIEREIGQYLVNHTSTGFSPTIIFNVNKDTTTEEEREAFKRFGDSKLSGSKGLKTMYSFNNGDEKGISIERVAVDQASKVYDYVAKEAECKICAAHRIDKKILGLGKEGNGLANNANELEVLSEYFQRKTINTFADEITEGLEEILMINGIEADLAFVPVKPLSMSLLDKEIEIEQGEPKNDSKTLDSYDDTEVGKAKDNTKEEGYVGYN